MKRLIILAALCCSAPLLAQTTTTIYGGTVKDLAQNTVTSGRITWQLNIPEGAVIPGSGSFVATIVSCLINSGGHPVSASDGVSPCVVTNNTALTPSGTSYTMCYQPYSITPGNCITTYATGGTVDVSTIVPTPATQPFYGGAALNPVLTNNQPFQGANSSGSLGSIVLVKPSNELQIGDISNKFAAQSYLFGGNAFEAVSGLGVIFTLPVQFAQFSVNGSVSLTGAQGNGASIQTYSTGAAVGPLCAAADGSATTTGCTNGSTVSLTTTGTPCATATLVSNVLNIPPCTGGSGSVAYTSPTLKFVPVVSGTGTTTTQGNSSISDDTAAGQASIADAWTMNNSATLAAQGTATSGQNYPCNTLTLGLSYYNAGTTPDAYTLGCFVNPGAAPTTLVTLYGPATLTPATANVGVGFLLAQNAGLQANVTNGNINTPKFKFRGATQNSSGVNQNDDWSLQGFQGTGNQPTSTFTFTHTGSTGQAIVSVPALVATGGTPGIKFTAAHFATYPACSGNEGLEEAVDDSTTATWGATVTGGGANHVKMWCDGSNWTVAAK